MYNDNKRLFVAMDTLFTAVLWLKGAHTNMHVRHNMAECSSTESGVVCANRRSIRRKLLEKEVESASKQSRTECETNNDEYSSAGATTAGAAQVTKQIPPQKKARSKGTKKSTTTNDEDSSVRATTTQAAPATKQQPTQRKARTSTSKGTKRPEPASGEASSTGTTTARAAQATQQKTYKKKARTSKTKAMKKSERDELLLSITSIDSKVVQWEVISKLKETFDNGLLKDFARVLCSLEQPLQDVVVHHHRYFGALYINSKKLPDSFLRFQLDWHNYCSIFLLSEEYSLQDIDYQELAEHPVSNLRSTWLEFCKANGVPVPQSNKVMITVSSVVYHFLLEHVTRFQQQLVKSGSVTIGTDEDGVYYRFGGASNKYQGQIMHSRILEVSGQGLHVFP